MGTHVNQVGSIDDPNLNPASVRTEINDIIDYMQGIVAVQESNMTAALAEMGATLEDFQYDAPIPPDDIISSFNWDDENYTSDMWNVLFSKVHAEISTGGNGIDEDVYNAMIAREQEARRVNQEREYQRGIDAIGESGFDLPAGQIAAFEKEITRDRNAKDQDALNAIMIKDFDTAIRNKEFSQTLGKDLELMLRSTFDKARERSLEAAKAAEDYIIRVYESAVKLFDSKWRGIEVEGRTYSDKANLAKAIADAKVTVIAQIIASALGGINASMSQGYSASKSETARWSFSKSLGNTLYEGHNFQDE